MFSLNELIWPQQKKDFTTQAELFKKLKWTL